MPKKITKPRPVRGKILVVGGGNRCGKATLFERLQKAIGLEPVNYESELFANSNFMGKLTHSEPGVGKAASKPTDIPITKIIVGPQWTHATADYHGDKETFLSHFIGVGEVCPCVCDGEEAERLIGRWGLKDVKVEIRNKYGKPTWIFHYVDGKCTAYAPDTMELKPESTQPVQHFLVRDGENYSSPDCFVGPDDYKHTEHAIIVDSEATAEALIARWGIKRAIVTWDRNLACSVRELEYVDGKGVSSRKIDVEDYARLVPCGICGKRIDPDTAVANGYNGDLCCTDHFSASAEEVEGATEQQTTIADLQGRLALAENRLDRMNVRKKKDKRKITEQGKKLQAYWHEVNKLKGEIKYLHVKLEQHEVHQSRLSFLALSSLIRVVRGEVKDPSLLTPVGESSLIKKGLIERDSDGNLRATKDGLFICKMFCKATGATDANERADQAEQKYLDEKSRRVKHGKRANELHNQNAELQRKNTDLHLERRTRDPKRITAQELYLLGAVITEKNIHTDTHVMDSLVGRGLIYAKPVDDGRSKLTPTDLGRRVFKCYCWVTSFGAPDESTANLRREVLKLVGEKAGARLELEEVRARLDEIRNIIHYRSIRVKLSGDTFAVEMNGLNYGTLIHALDGTGKFAPQS